MNKWFQIDERTELVNGRLSFIFLGLTQFALYVAIVYQRYIEGVPNVYYNDVAIIMILSILGYWAARFYFGGILPVLSGRQLLAIYLLFVGIVVIAHTLVHGRPAPGEWLARLAPIFGGPAVLIGFYALLAYCGKKRLENQLAAQSDG